MYKELACYDVDASEHKVRTAIFFAIKNGFAGISIPATYLQAMKDFIPDGIDFSTPIDYPCGSMDLATRNSATLGAIRRGVSAVDIVVSHNLVVNKQGKKLSDDLTTKKQMCAENDVTPRVMLEYRCYDDSQLLFALDAIKDVKIEYIYLSTGTKVDDLDDQIILAQTKAKSRGLKTIINANIWQKEHIAKIEKSGVFGYRINSIAFAEALYGVL